MKRTLSGLMGLVGLGLAGLAVFANYFGIGHKGGWGPGRSIVAGSGVFLLVIAFLIATWQFWGRGLTQIQAALSRSVAGLLERPAIRRSLLAIRAHLTIWKAGWDRQPFVRWIDAHLKPPILQGLEKVRASRPVRYFSRSQGRQAGLAAVLLGAGILVVYVWYVSVGHWTAWPGTTGDYDMLAQAFQHGHPYLLVTPPPALLKLADPYVFTSRRGISIPWDVSLYDGKYYIYWGPMPAVVLIFFHLFHPKAIGDEVLVFVFVSGAFLFEALLLLRMRTRFFPDVGWGYILPGIVMAGLANPLPWLLNRPAVYEAAIAGGQFFLLAGLYWGMCAVEGPRFHLWNGVVASAFWLFAVASRLTLAPAAIFLLLATAWRALRLVTHVRNKLSALAAVFLPFSAGLACLGWYNKIRFGSWLETGNRYQLTGNTAQVTGSNIFSLSNIAYNLQNYLINPYRTMTIFPFVKPEWGGISIFFPVRGSIYSNSEQVSGMIPTIPYVLLAIIPVLYLLGCSALFLARSCHKTLPVRIQLRDGFFNWTTFTLTGTLLCAFGPVLLYMTSYMRYLADGVPLLVLLATLGFWQGAQYLIKMPGFQRLFVLLVVLLVLMSAVISLLLAVTGYEARFEHLNPVLFDQLTRLFMW